MRLYFIQCLLLVVSCVSFAETGSTGLYSAVVSVKDREQESFQQAAEKALLLVLVKNSGQTQAQIKSSPRAAAALKKAPSLILQFAYTRDSGTANGLLLDVRFSKRYVQKLLETNGLTIWPANRPSILVLPVVQNQGFKVLVNQVNARNFSNFDKILLNNAQRFALSAELTRGGGSQLDALWRLDQAAVSQLVTQARKDAAFLARIHTTNNGYLGSWTYSFNGKAQSIDVSAVSAADFTKQGFDWLAGLLARQYAVQLTAAHNETLLLLSGVDNETDYQQALDYLNKHPLIDHVYVLEALGNMLQLSLVLKADVSQLQRALLLDKKLKAQTGQASSDDMVLRYVW